MRRHKYYKDGPNGLVIETPRAMRHAYAKVTTGKLDYSAARQGFRKTARPHTIAHPPVTRRYLAGLRRAAQKAGRHSPR